MPQSKITIIGLETFLNPDNSLFEELTLPSGIDLDTLKGAIFLRCQEFEALYSDPDFMIQAIKVWGMKYYWTFDRWVKLINKEYDPLFNKDYHEVITDTHAGNFQRAGTGNNYGNSSDSGSSTGQNVNTHSEKAYNSGSSFVETEKDAEASSGTTSNSNQYANTSSDSASGNDSYTNNHSLHGYGNIGVTAVQTLFMKELDVAKFNMYEHIADLFASEFCIMIY